MTLARYFVFHQDGNWLVVFDGRVMSHFATKTAALDSARGMANLMGAMHYDADVMVEEGDKPLELAWTFGRDKLISPAKRRREGKARPVVAESKVTPVEAVTENRAGA